MDAKKAREVASRIHHCRVIDQFRDVSEYIERAVNKGEFQTNYYEDLLFDTKEMLENEGYTINEHSNQKDGTTITITW